MSATEEGRGRERERERVKERAFGLSLTGERGYILYFVLYQIE
jgi:hypothetical protein